MATSGFRFAGRDDVPALVDLIDAAYRGDRSRVGWTTEADLLGGQRIDAAMLEAELADPRAVVLVLESDGGPVACCRLRRADTGPAELGLFAVDPAHQGDGLGSRVLAEAERLVREDWSSDGLRLSVIDVRADLLAWYRRRGYRPTGATEQFPYGDERFGVPRRDDLRFAVLEKRLR